MASSGGIMAVLGFTAPELMAVALAVGILAGAFITYKNNLEQARISAENFKKSQEDLNYVLGKGGEEAKKRADDIDKVILEYDTQTTKLKNIRKEMENMSAEDPRFGELANKLNDAKKALSDTEKELANLGVTAEEARGKINELNKSQEFSKQINESLSKLDLASKQQKELDTVNNLITSYDSWVNKKNKSKQEDEKLVAISATLESKLKDLGISYELNSKGLIANTDGVRGLVKAKVDLTNTSISSATKEMTIEKQRLSVMLTSIKTELEARKALASALAGSSSDFAKASAGERRANELITDPLGLKRDKSLDKTTSFLEGQAKQYEDAVNSFGKAIDEVASKTAGVPNLLSGVGDSKDTTSKSSSTATKTQITLMTALQKQLEANNYQLELQRKLTSELAEDDPKRIDSLKKEISLLAQRQQLTTKQADVLRAEKASIEAKIKSNSATMEEKKRLEEINTEIYALKLSWQDLNGEMKNAGKSIDDFYATAIEKAKKKTEELIKKSEDLVKTMKDKLKDAIDADINSIENERDAFIKAKEAEIEALENQKDAMSDMYDIQIDQAKTNLDNYNATVDKQEEINKLKEIENSILEENVEYAKALKELEDKRNNILNERNVRMLNKQGTAFEFISDPLALADVNKEIADLTEKHTETLGDLVNRKNEEVKDQAIKAEQSRLQAVIDRISKEKKANEDNYNNQIKLIQKSKQTEVDAYNARIESLKLFEESMLKAVDDSSILQFSKQSTLYSNLLTADQTYFKDKISGYKKMVDDINIELARIQAINAMAGGGGGGGGGSYNMQLPSGVSPTSPSSTNQNIQRPSSFTPSAPVVGNPVSGSWLKHHDGIESGLVGNLPMPKNWEQVELLAKGEAVINAPQMNNLANFVNSAIPKIAQNKTSSQSIFNFDKLVLPSVKDANSFVKELQRIRIINT